MSGASRRIMRDATRRRRRETYKEGWTYTPDPYLIVADWLLFIGGVMIVIGLGVAISAGVWFLLADLVTTNIAPEPFDLPPIRPYFLNR